MSDFNSYSAYTPTQEEAQGTPHIPFKNDEKVTRVTFVDGVGTLEQSERVTSFNSRDINTFPADDWRSTATDLNGSPSAMVGDSTLVTLNGTQATARDFEKAGYLEKDDRGNYRLPSEKPPEDASEAQQAEARRHRAVLPPAAHATVNAALEGLSMDGVDTVTQFGVGVALGQLPVSMLARQFSTMTGYDIEASEARIATVQGVYQTQADEYLVSQQGLHRDELQDFYEFARGLQNRDALSKAVNGQVYSKQMSGYGSLVKLYLSKTAPSQKMVKANGMETKTSADGAALVKLHGMWMTTKVAAFNGWI
ncbi:hypothetical protein RCH09_003505 [Actimicrobium sp. GrIS 1.19]|uniref:hypothetical protein n=1 Tax=Actimicrobium sp. GrIS 1.19 TaxID=3071708 RepID=UPI002E0C28AA|nr:hypothetical protein [Actimicrobium sp. GrIS 1.19]